MRRIVRVGTRKSRLATVQTRIVTDLIESRFPELELQLVPMSTLGDRLPEEKRAAAEGKDAFTEDIDRALADGRIDLAVHSMKDLPGKIPESLAIGATPVRADPRDVLVSKAGEGLSELPDGSVIGTSSIRRKAQLLALRKDISVVELHGNVDTRLSKLRASSSGLDAIVVAAAGIERLGESARITQYFEPAELVPAPAQGAIAVEMRRGDENMSAVLSAIDNPRVRAETTSERSFSSALGLDCDVPAGATATLARVQRLALTAAIVSPDGRLVVRGSKESKSEDAAILGQELARELLSRGGREILRELHDL